MKNKLTALVILLLVALAPLSALAVTWTSAGSFLWDPTDWAGEMINGTLDAYDGCYFLEVDGMPYRSPTGAPPTLSMSGRQAEWPEATMAPNLFARRLVYVPATGGDYARYLDVIRNSGTTDRTTTITIRGNLGSDGGTVRWAESSGSSVLGVEDDWFGTDDFDMGGDPSLAHVFQGTGGLVRAESVMLSFDNMSWSFRVTVPAGGRVAILTFAIQKPSQADARTEAEALVLPDATALVGLDAYLPEIVNFPVFAPCAGADGTACTGTSGASGRCYGGNCCTGCWDGARCNGGRLGAACGTGGGACTSCIDSDPCTIDACPTGTCTNTMAPAGAACDDGLFCTISETCSAGGVCGAGIPNACSDGVSCTADTCNESTDSCSHAPASDTCIIDGWCVADGTPGPSPCVSCDSSRSTTAWSPVAAGTACGATTCSMGIVSGAPTCDSMGTCVPPEAMTCVTGRCEDFVSCEPGCESGADCPAGYICNLAAACERLRALGAGCTDGSECESGSCADGVCCESACSGPCVACDRFASAGTCAPHAAGTDPEAGCGRGTCDGAGACLGDATDAGPTSADGGPAMADGGSLPPDDDGGGCGCIAARRAPPAAIWIGVTAILGLLLRRRRMRGRPHARGQQARDDSVRMARRHRV